MSFVKAEMIYDCFDSITFDDQNSPKLRDNGKAGIGFQRPENSKPSWLKNKLDKDKAKADSKYFVPNQPRHNSRKAKSGWTKNQPRRDLNGHKMKSKLNRSHRIQLAVGPQPLRLRNHNFGLAHRIMVKSLATSRLDPLGITDSACKNQLVVVSVQYGPFNPYIPIRSTTIGESRVARDPIAMHTSWRSNSDIASVTRVSMTFRVVRTNQYNQDLGLIHSTNGNHLESLNEDTSLKLGRPYPHFDGPIEGSSINHQVTIYLHAQNITMFPTNETWYFASQILVSSSGGLILILTAQSTRN
ncbi:beta-bisabolene synthase-like [Dorcoceras hygrometricum]|uniref:Beta-bisabolene synthase-like n=1 Tax=Dorcoceras hygrometricum TaxID=472368 RepID=A0A2Z7C7P9_9LAMI|nr:beta-bisabolene synthase-like [Dorcoceras hygrometricum]